VFDRWQYEVTSGGRIFYLVDDPTELPTAPSRYARAVWSPRVTPFLLILATVAAFVVASGTPARADDTCSTGQICVWSGTFYTGTKTTYTLDELADLGCVNVTHQSLKIGAAPVLTATTSYRETNCFAVGDREDTVSLLGTATGNPEFSFGTANSLSFLGVGSG
jgi:hypothetical protein